MLGRDRAGVRLAVVVLCRTLFSHDRPLEVLAHMGPLGPRHRMPARQGCRDGLSSDEDTTSRDNRKQHEANKVISCMHSKYLLFRCIPSFIQVHHILRICVSSVYLSKPPSKFSHHLNSIVLHISLNHGVNFRLPSLNIAFSSSSVT